MSQTLALVAELKRAMKEAGRTYRELAAHLELSEASVKRMAELLRNTTLSERQERFVDTIYESGCTLLALINDILDFSKIEAGKLGIETIGVDLRQLVEQAAEAFIEPAGKKGIELMTAVPAEAHTAVLTDPVRLRQVIVNLLSNAIKFTESGEITVRLDIRDEDDNHVVVRIEVSDTGIGIRKENQAAIFESFTQEDGTTTRVYGGTGLGLAISRQIVELMSCFVQYCPHKLEGRDWTQPEREAFGQTVIDQIARYSPNFKDLILHVEIRTPEDIEAEIGITEGNIFHGELTLDQLLFNRPVPGFSQYRAPVSGLYLCGSSTHPGGGVMQAKAADYDRWIEGMRQFRRKLKEAVASE